MRQVSLLVISVRPVPGNGTSAEKQGTNDAPATNGHEFHEFIKASFI
jgi:hypothetical protein